jgi:hypothetical protein
MLEWLRDRLDAGSDAVLAALLVVCVQSLTLEGAVLVLCLLASRMLVANSLKKELLVKAPSSTFL